MAIESDVRVKRHLPMVNPTVAKEDMQPAMQSNAELDAEIEAELKAFEESERERIGVRKERKQWADTMLNPTMKKKEKDGVTLLITGLTQAQDFLVEGALRGLGYRVEWIGTSDQAGLQTGKEYGNRGQCNPTYFTVGGLVKHLIDLRDSTGMSSEEIVKKYVFLTAGACGPCRFGMYVTEYRKALRDAGFDGFRVMLFQQQGGLSQATGDDVGLEMNPKFFIGIIKAVVCGDVLNALAYRIRPYEIEVGATNRASERAKQILYTALYEKTNIFMALYKARSEFEAVQVDKLRPRVKTSIIGEFWAMTTEGDGNYYLQRFLESEGAENDIQLTTAWLLYNIWEVSRDTRVRAHLREFDSGQYGLKGYEEFGVGKRLAIMRLAEHGLRLGFQAFAVPLGLFGYKLPDMELVAEVAKDYYNNDLRGGEGHMEVGKLIVNAVHNKAHVTVSVKPFGCMPSSGVSDGVQSLITSRFPGSIYCAVETSGDGATNFYSRVQMYMFKGRAAAEAEFERALTENNVTLEQVRGYLAANPKSKFNSPLYKPAHRYAGTAADLVAEIAPYITQTAVQRTVVRAKATRASIAATLSKVPGLVTRAVDAVKSEEFRTQIKADIELGGDLLSGRVRDDVAPLLKRLAHRAMFNRDPEVTTTTERTATVGNVSAQA
ncbi:MAG: 2-hydroxyglutaryl-CoA dehydratase [Deltaproteobacteria bacterium]|nr:2-hydroxyglutaryl-CoA dehydratase [Deltaproteobacteria bacterium]